MSDVSAVIRDYKTNDEEGITTLFSEVFGKEMSIEQWNWKYFIPGNGSIYSKVAEDASGKIIGYAGAIPLRGVFQNRALQFFQIADVMVHAEARGFLGRKSVFDSLMKTMFEDIREEFHDVFCYGFPGTRPFILGKRVRVYDSIEEATDCTIDLRSSFFNPYRIRRISWNDDGLDILWAKLSKDFALSLIRDRVYLQWRYETNPFFSYQLLGCFRSGKLVGWAVIRESGNEILVIDLLVERKKYRQLLRALGNFLISKGKKTIHIWLSMNWKKELHHYKTDRTTVVVTNMVWKLPVQTSVAKDNLFYTMGDTDIF